MHISVVNANPNANANTDANARLAGLAQFVQNLSKKY